DLRSLLTFP
ncbi:hypothetical protein CP8484711_0712B, partial [Chlamydia psittaci 84-8471/1]